MHEPNEQSPQSVFTKIHLEAGAKMEAAIAELQAIAQEVDAETLLIHLFLLLGMGPIDTFRESEHGTVSAKIEHAAYHLIPFFGASVGKVTATHIDRAARVIEIAFREFIAKQAFEPVPDNDVDRLIRQFTLDVALVRGSAYLEQTLREIVEIQGRFESWFTERVGIGPTRASATSHQ